MIMPLRMRGGKVRERELTQEGKGKLALDFPFRGNLFVTLYTTWLTDTYLMSKYMFIQLQLRV